MQRSTGPAGLSDPGSDAHDHPHDDQWYSLVLASDYRVDDIERMWSAIAQHRTRLSDLGAHHVLLYVSIAEPERVLMTIGLRNHRPVAELLRSPLLFEWFDIAGVDNIPAIFAGHAVEKIDLAPTDCAATPTGVVIGAISAVDDVDALMARVRIGRDRFARAGVRKIWVYRAVDDGSEILTLLEVDDAETAQRWANPPGAIAEWMPGLIGARIARQPEKAASNGTLPGTGAYPSVFVGQLANTMSTDATR